MSQNTDNSLNQIPNRQGLIYEKFANILVLGMVITFDAAVMIYMVVYFIIVNPQNPRFSLKEAEINNLKLTTPSSINSSIQLTILSINRNKKLGIYYDDLVLHTSYKGERIAPEAFIDPFYVDHGETIPVEVSLVGNQQHVDSYLASQLQHDQDNGNMELEFKLTGNLRYKDGKYWFSDTIRLTVKCRTLVKFESKTPLSSTTQNTVVCSVK